MRRLLFINCLLVSLVVSAQDLTVEGLGLKPPKTSCTSVKDQFMSSTCWSFSSTSLLESEFMKMGKGQVDLSEMFIARYSMLRKIQRHLKLKGANFFTPGGQFHDGVWVIKNFGLVPEEVYSGKGRNEMNHNHSLMDTALSQLMKEFVAKDITELDREQEASINQLLDYYYGPVPTEFIYKGRTYTPHSFREQYLGINLDDYVELTSYTHHPFYTQFILEDKYNWTSDKYWNVPLADFSLITNSALEKGYTVGWDGDATDYGFDFTNGLAHYLNMIKLSMQAERQSAFETQTTQLDHMMHITGKVKDNKGESWYYIKNSWGVSNRYGGFMFMREDYFSIRTVAIIVNKKAIPPTIRAKLGI
ncbi:MAG TPA: C1 family peptidase [Chitinophagaceae bacterium]|nr:C1 family peptidase [Chitinophagaceae bacterium]